MTSTIARNARRATGGDYSESKLASQGQMSGDFDCRPCLRSRREPFSAARVQFNMKHDHALPQPVRSLCSEIGPEDGIDPREFLRGYARKKGGRKTLQLCAQIAETLNYAFAAVCNNDIVRELGVVSVQPAPDESRLLVTVSPSLNDACDPLEILEQLSAVHGKLRAEIANSIHRKKVPELTFRVLTEQTRLI